MDCFFPFYSRSDISKVHVMVIKDLLENDEREVFFTLHICCLLLHRELRNLLKILRADADRKYCMNKTDEPRR